MSASALTDQSFAVSLNSTTLIVTVSLLLLVFYIGKRSGKKSAIADESLNKGAGNASKGFKFFFEKIERLLDNIMEQFQKRKTKGSDLQPGRLGGNKGKEQQPEREQEQLKEKQISESRLLRLLERALLMGRVLGASPDFPAVSAAQAAMAYNSQISQLQTASQLAANIGNTGVATPSQRLSPLGVSHDAQLSTQLAAKISASPSSDHHATRTAMERPLALFSSLSPKILGHSHNPFDGVLANTLSQLLKLSSHAIPPVLKDLGQTLTPQKEAEQSRTPTQEPAKTQTPEKAKEPQKQEPAKQEPAKQEPVKAPEPKQPESPKNEVTVKLVFGQASSTGITLTSVTLATVPINTMTPSISNTKEFTQQYGNHNFESAINSSTSAVSRGH